MLHPAYRLPRAASIAILLGSAYVPVPALGGGQAPPRERVEEIAAMLPAGATGVGRPISDREAWRRWRSLDGFEDMIARAKRAAGEPLPPMTDDVYLDFSRTGNRDRGQRVIRERHGRFPLLVLAECLEAEGRFLPAIARAVQSVCEEATWVLPAHDRGLGNYRRRTVEIDLNSAATSWNLATAIYWLGDRLDAKTRRTALEELERRTFGPYESSVETGKPRLWWVTGSNNWNAVCHAGVVGAALSVIESPTRRAFFIASAEKNIEHFLGGFTPDGYCSEGLGYWNYGFGHYLLLAETVREATRGELDLLAPPEIQKIARFGRRMEIVRGVYPAFADCSVRSEPSARILAVLERRLGLPAPNAEAGVLTSPTTSLFTLGAYGFPALAEKPRDPAPAPEETALRDWFPDAGVLICRPRATRSDALGAALKGGHNAEHHNHNDVGSYVVALGGETPLVDPGAEVYTARTFSSRRYESDVLNSFGHPVPRVAGKLQRTGRSAAAAVLRAEFTDSRDTLALDLRTVYVVPGLERLERTFEYHREGRGALIVTDQVKCKGPETFETALVTFLDWHRAGTNRLSIGTGPAGVEVTLDSGDVPFEIVSDVIDENVRAPKKPTRIAIRLAKPVSAARVRLEIRPASHSASSDAGSPSS